MGENIGAFFVIWGLVNVEHGGGVLGAGGESVAIGRLSPIPFITFVGMKAKSKKSIWKQKNELNDFNKTLEG